MAPVIHEYTADTAPGGPVDTRLAREADTGEIGKAYEGLGNSVSQFGAQIQKRAAQSEISSLSAQLAQAHADFSGNLDDTLQNADPNDRGISDKFMQSYDDKMGEIADNISTPQAQRFFEKANSRMRASFQISAMHGQSALAGHQAVEDANVTVGNYAASLLNDPSAFKDTQELNAMSIQAQVDNGTIDKVTASKLTDQGNVELAKAAVRGWIALDPQGTKKRLADGEWDSYIGGDAKYQLERESEQGINAQRIEGERQDAIQKKVLKDKQESTQDKMLSQLYGNGLSTDDVIKNPVLDFNQKNQLLKMIESNKDNKIKTDPSTFINLFERVHAAEGDPNRITDPDIFNGYLGKGLTIPDIQTLRNELSNKKTPQGQIEDTLKKNFLESIKNQLTKTNALVGIRDPEGDLQYQAFLSQVLPKIAADQKAGKNITQYLDPMNAEYYGKLVTPFLRSPQQIMKSILAPPGSIAPNSNGSPSAAAPQAPVTQAKQVEPRRHGESPADYLDRIKGKK